jgi:wyosine [tRNA(Phe)-imidazoG37] synthetase (radical SAM superfamily)
MASHVFGPVPSRRLGRSLGVDLVPFKTCSYDCIYCQLGRTTHKTLERREWFPLDEILRDVETSLASAPDYITLSGSGEPTLYSGLGGLIAAIKRITEVPIAAITNGSLLWDPQVREELSAADLVIPSLDAGDAATFRHVNRPHEGVDFDRMVEGLVAFRGGYPGRLWLEVFLLDGVTAIAAEVAKIVRIVRRIRPERVQLNTVARPPAEGFACPVPREEMERLAELFAPRAEVIADYRGTHGHPEFAVRREEVLALLRRRPCTVEDLSAGLGMHRNEVAKFLGELAGGGLLAERTVGGRLYYLARAAEKLG